MIKISRFVFLTLLTGLFAQGAFAQAWPNRPIRWVIPYPAGGSGDVLTRALAQQLAVRIGQPVSVENRPGANGLIGSDVVAKAAPDGYTLLMGVIGPLTVLPHLVKMPYDPVKDLAPIGMLASVANIVVVRKDSPIRTLKDLIDAARPRPGEINYGTTGVGSSGQLSAGLLGGMAGVKFTNIGYAGGAPAMVDLLAGRLDFMFDNAPTAAARVRSGDLRALAITSPRRSSVMPEIPTVAELGNPGYDAGSWFGALAPAGTPQPVIERLNAELVAILKEPALNAQLTRQMFDITPSTPLEFAQFIDAESRKWAKVIRDNNIKAD
jgi:tripartite-type tricarboxylate transporter receptor subunit TctC